MNAHDVIRAAHAMSTTVIKSYIEDLSDADLMLRPNPACNHLAWQLGHLISSECMLLESICPGASAKLPAGFAEAHNKEHAGSNDASRFCAKSTYLQLWDQVEAATIAALEKFSPDDLDKPGPEHFRAMFPTVGHVLLLIANHGLMHAGQFVPVRRALGKPIKI